MGLFHFPYKGKSGMKPFLDTFSFIMIRVDVGKPVFCICLKQYCRSAAEEIRCIFNDI